MNRRRETSSNASRRQAGTSVVEMAIVLPLLLVVIFAIGDFGIAYTHWNSLTNAAREGARTGVVFRAPCNAGIRCIQRSMRSRLKSSSAVSL